MTIITVVFSVSFDCGCKCEKYVGGKSWVVHMTCNNKKDEHREALAASADEYLKTLSTNEFPHVQHDLG